MAFPLANFAADAFGGRRLLFCQCLRKGLDEIFIKVAVVVIRFASMVPLHWCCDDVANFLQQVG